MKRTKHRSESCSQNSIVKGRLRVACAQGGLNIFWDGHRIDNGSGLNVAIDTLRLWTDSGKGDWIILEKGRDYLKAKVVFKELPLSQVWTIKIKEENQICWQIDMEIEELLHIDEFRIAYLVSPQYRAWFSDYLQADFPRINDSPCNLYFQDRPISIVGVRFPLEGRPIPSVMFEVQENNLPGFIQNSSLDINAHIIGFRQVYPEEKREYFPGKYSLFTGKISLFESDYFLDTKIESLRQSDLSKLNPDKIENKKPKRKLRVLLANLPWYSENKIGVRAGSRWPHIKDKSEGEYLPFPFFLAHAASLLQKYNFEVIFLDAISEQMKEDRFLEKISEMDLDYLVAETSIPSFYHDLEILKKIRKTGIPILLCGPNAEIYKPQFLKENGFIDFVLFGEYEFTLLELMRCLQNGKTLNEVKGLIFRCNGSIVKNPKREPSDIDLLPWPYRDGLAMDKYLDLPGGIPFPSVQMLASRGCPFGCNFCLWPQIIYQGTHYRARDIKDVVDEMEYLIREKGFKSIYFDDDTFNVGRERMLKFCKMIKERKLENTPWAIMARADLMDAEILSEMRSAGLWAVKYGVESAAGLLVGNCHKGLDLSKTTEIIKITKDLGIKVHLTFCFGLPGETKETIQKTIDYALDLDPHSVQFSILTPFPGTRIFEELDNQGRILTKDWSKYDGHHSCVFQPHNLSAQDLEKAKNSAYAFWAESKRSKRGFWGDWIRFRKYLQERGVGFAIRKGLGYLTFVLIKKQKYLKELAYLENKDIRFNKDLIKQNKGRIPAQGKKIGGSHRESFIKLLERKIKQGGLSRFFFKILNYIKSGRFLHNYLDILGIYNGELAFTGPIHVQIDLTYKCNNNCIACWCNSPLLEEKELPEQTKKQTLPLSLVKNVLNELSAMGTQEIYFSGGGEPFVHPQIMEILEYAKKKRFICYVNTNFTLLDKDKIKRIIDLGVDYLTVSVWAANPKTYAAAHPNKDEKTFTQIIENLKFLNESKRKKPHIKLYNVIFSLNYRELDAMINLAKETKSESIEFTLVDTIPGKTDKLLLKPAQIKELQENANKISKRLDKNGCYAGVELLGFDSFLRRISSASDLIQATYDRNIIDSMPCYIGWCFGRIMPNGDVNACLKAHRIPVGNLYQESFRNIWNGRKQRDFRKNTLICEKKGDFFKFIGNDAGIKEAGCYKSCDDIGRNMYMHSRINSLTSPERWLLNSLSRVTRIRLNREKTKNKLWIKYAPGSKK